MGGMEEREDGKERMLSNPGAARHGNFINYYEFHPPEERLRLLPGNFGSRLVPEKGPILVLDVGCNAGVSSSSSSLFQIEGHQPTMALLAAAQHGNLPAFEAVLANEELAGHEIGHIVHSRSGDSALHVAARAGHPGVLEVLLAHGLGAEVRNLEGKTALHEAAQAGNLAAVSVLLNAGAEVDAIKRADWTPLMLACTKQDNTEVVQKLIEAGAGVGLKNKDGWTAWHLAVRTGDMNLLRLLLAVSPECWDTVSKNGRTPLHTACLAGHADVLDLLLSTPGQSGYINAADSCGNTPLLESARGSHPDCMLRLKQQPELDLAVRDSMGRGVGHVAVQAGALQCLNLCKEWGLLEDAHSTLEVCVVQSFKSKSKLWFPGSRSYPHCSSRGSARSNKNAH